MKTLKSLAAGQHVGPWQRAMAQRLGLAFVEGLQKEVPAYLNHGRWVADCPGCRGAELVEPGEGFYCLGCGNAANAGHPMAIVWPADRREIERVLAVRPMEHQNWVPGETLADLIHDNEEQLHGSVTA